MSKYLLDTNIISELRKARPHGAVKAWFLQLDAADWALSAITFGELQQGIERTRQQNPAMAAALEEWLEELLETSNILDINPEICREWARLLLGRSRALSEDAFIAATARVHGLTIATRNTRDFQEFGVLLLNPFQNALD